MAQRRRGAAEPIRLTTAQRCRLQRLVDSTGVDARTRRRALIVLLSAAGQSGEQVATLLGVTRRTVTDARARWRHGAQRALAEGARGGRPPRADALYVRQLVSTATRDPRAVGFAFTRWTAPRLAAYMARQTGVRLTARWVRELLHRRGLVWRRTKRTTRHLADPDAVAAMRQRISRLKKGLAGARRTTICGSATV